MGPFPSMGLPSASTTRPRRASPTGTSTWAGQYFGRGHGKNRTYNLSGTLDGLAFLDQSVRTEKHHTNLAGFQVHAHALDTRGEPAIPLASVVACWSMWLRVLDKLLGLDVAHAVNTGNTVTVPLSTSVPLNMRWRCGLPDGKHTSSLGETVLLLDATDPLLEDRGHLGRGGLCFGGIGSDGVGEGRGAGLVWWGTWSVRGRRLGRGELPPPICPAPQPASIAHRTSSIAAPMVSRGDSWSQRRWRGGLQAHVQADAMDLPTQFCPWQRLQRPGGSTGGWLSRTLLRCSKDCSNGTATN